MSTNGKPVKTISMSVSPPQSIFYPNRHSIILPWQMPISFWLDIWQYHLGLTDANIFYPDRQQYPIVLTDVRNLSPKWNLNYIKKKPCLVEKAICCRVISRQSLIVRQQPVANVEGGWGFWNKISFQFWAIVFFGGTAVQFGPNILSTFIVKYKIIQSVAVVLENICRISIYTNKYICVWLKHTHTHTHTHTSQ